MGVYTIVVALRRGPPDGAVPGHEFLMVQNRRRGDRWELPGGRANGEETPLACARREFHEETGHDLEDATLIGERRGELGDGFVFLGRAGPRRGAPLEDEIGQIRYFARLPGRGDLSFPDDPYDDLFAAVRARLGSAQGQTRSGPAGR
ncbi:MAG: NUDIX hydrolase [Euryarchaeota archaeon]|nr:NUDIX hydrolase [Euryarchaeota archaeon]